jgi:quercetin dioxygenase-like cupin family protein
MELKAIPWTKETPPTEENLRESLVEQDLRIFRWAGQPDGVFAGHTHGYHKIIYVIDGSIKFDFPARQQSITLNRGDRLDLPAGVRHSAVVGMDGVTCLEAHVY